MITFDDTYTLESFGLIAQPGQMHEVAAGTRDRIVEIPGMAGAYDFGADLRERRFGLPLAWAKEIRRGNLQAQIRRFAALLMDSCGQPRNIKMVFDYEPDKHYTVRYSGNTPPERLLSLAFFTLPMMAADPFAYSNATNNEVTWGSETITFDSDYLMGHEGGDTKTITTGTSFNAVMSGYVAQRPTITIVGSGLNVTIDANGSSFTIADLDGATWVINGTRRQVSKNGVNALSAFDGDFIELVNGDNTITVSGSSMNFSLQITFRDKYL